MSKKKDTWSQIIERLGSKLPKPEFNTWFSQTSLKKFDPGSAVIEVPNKFFAQWLGDKYLIEIKNAFKKIGKQAPEIRFVYDHPPNRSTTPQTQSTKKSDRHRNDSLNSSMTFQRFITGEYNQFAYSSALEVADRPALKYNPLYIFSEKSLGKTHLLHAVGNHLVSKNPFSRIKYISSDLFTSNFTHYIQSQKIHQFREKYRHLDLLLFDDVQFLVDRKKTQEEFLSIFNSVYGEKKQIVIAGDRPPNKLKNMNPQLKSRLEWGLITEIQFPDQDKKIQFIKEKAKIDHIDIPEDVIFFIAKSNNDIKMLIKNIVRLETYASLDKGKINISAVKSFIKKNNRIEIGVEDIKSLTAGYFNISPATLVSNRRKRAYSYPRQLAMYLCRKYTDLSFKEIGDSFGHKDHSTVIYSVRRIEKQKAQKKDIQDDLKNIENLLV